MCRGRSEGLDAVDSRVCFTEGMEACGESGGLLSGGWLQAFLCSGFIRSLAFGRIFPVYQNPVAQRSVPSCHKRVCPFYVI